MARKKATRSRPNVDALEQSAEFSRQHKGDLGRFGDVFAEDVPKWKVAEGGHEVAIFPYPVRDPASSPFRRKGNRFNLDRWSAEILEAGEAADYRLTALVHYNMGVNKDSVLCLRMINEKCPICEERVKLDEEDPAYRALGPSRRTFYNVAVLDSDTERDKDIQVWDAPSQSIEDVLVDLSKPRRGGTLPFWKPEEGYIVTFDRRGSGLNTKWTNVRIEKLEQCDFADEELDELFEAALPFDEIVEVKAYEELQELLGETALGSAEENGSEPITQPSNTRRSRQRAAPEDDDIPEHPTPATRRRGGIHQDPTPDDEGTAAAEVAPDCFGLECNTKPECDDCPEDTFNPCYAETRERKTAGSSKPAGGKKRQRLTRRK